MIVVHTVKRTSGKARNQKGHEWFYYCDEITDISRKLFNTALKFEDLCEVRIVPKTGCYVVEVVYSEPDNSQFFCSLNPELAEAIDKGTISFIRVLDVSLVHLL